MNEVTMKICFALLCAFLTAALIGPFAIPVLTRLKFGQEIREIGPSWHKKKSGTPTMGGLIFIISACIWAVVFAKSKEVYLLVGISLSFGLIGFIDDFIKVVMKRNLGLTEIQKLVLQIIASVIFIIIGMRLSLFDTSIIIPFVKTPVNIRWFYIPLALFVIVGGTNSVNLTDGLDGLAASVTVIVCLFFALVSYKTSQVGTSVFMSALAGGCIGFLLYNAYPAKVFMGDTGSLFLGGAISGAALLLKMPIVLIIAGGVYVIETLSVIIQVTYYKKTKKRIFKMSPIHHHFEMCGWSERKIVVTAICSSLVLCIIAYFSV